MKLKKILLSGLSLVLVAALAIGGTVAFLKDDDSDVNVMTLGNVSIAQHEYERATKADGSYKTTTVDGVTSYELQDFTQGKPLLPIVGDPNEPGNSDAYAGWDSIPVRMSQKNSYGGMKVFAGKNAQDKFVTVENTGKTDAYVRTIIAIEIGSTNGALIGQSYQDSAWTRTAVDNIVIDGNTYRVFEYNYPGALLSDGTYRHENGILPAGDTTYPNLAQVYLKHNATNEDMEDIDGNNNGTLDILVLSQAVQAAGFTNAKTALDTAFGKSADKAAEWFGGMIIPVYAEDAEQVEKVLENGGELFLQENISADKHTVNEGVKVDIDLQDNTLSGIVNNKGEMNVSGGKMEADYMNNYGDATFSDVEMKAGTSTDYANIGRANSVTEYNNVNIEAEGGAIGLVDGAEAVFNSGSVKVIGSTTNPRYNFYVVGDGTKLTINDGTFSFTSTTLKRSYIYAGAGATVTINGGTFGPASTRQAAILGDGKVIIKGGTFGFDPSTWVAEGYEAVKDGSTWTVSAK